MATTAAFAFNRRFAIGTKTMPTATSTGGIGVRNDTKTAAHHVFEVIHHRAFEQWQTHFIHHDIDPVAFKNRVAIQSAVVYCHAVTVATAPAAFDKNTHRSIELVVFLEDFFGFVCAELGHANHKNRVALSNLRKGALLYQFMPSVQHFGLVGRHTQALAARAWS